MTRKAHTLFHDGAVPARGTVWRHVNTHHYEVEGIALTDTDDPTKYVILCGLHDSRRWVRTLENFYGTHPSGEKRFIQVVGTPRKKSEQDNPDARDTAVASRLIMRPFPDPDDVLKAVQRVRGLNITRAEAILISKQLGAAQNAIVGDAYKAAGAALAPVWMDVGEDLLLQLVSQSFAPSIAAMIHIVDTYVKNQNDPANEMVSMVSVQNIGHELGMTRLGAAWRTLRIFADTVKASMNGKPPEPVRADEGKVTEFTTIINESKVGTFKGIKRKIRKAVRKELRRMWEENPEAFSGPIGPQGPQGMTGEPGACNCARNGFLD